MRQSLKIGREGGEQMLTSYAYKLFFIIFAFAVATASNAAILSRETVLVIDPPLPTSNDRISATAYHIGELPWIIESIRYEGNNVVVDLGRPDLSQILTPTPAPRYTTAWLQPLVAGTYQIKVTLKLYSFDTDAPNYIDYSFAPQSITVEAAMASGTVDAVEYYHAELDHYFMTASPAEVAVIDSGRFHGWARTGHIFKVFPSAQPDSIPVCRYYIPPEKGNSHFFGVATVQSATPSSGDECRIIERANIFKNEPLLGFVKETANAFYVLPPDHGSGACSANYQPVYRLWNQRQDTNHRYTTDLAVRNQMVAKGYASEGYGAYGVVMCVPN